MLFTKLYDYQQSAARFALERSSAALFFEQGTGKTWITAGVIEKMASDSSFRGLVIVPLANIETTWQTLLRKIDGLKIARSWNEFKKLKGPRLYLAHYEGLHHRVVKHPWSLVVYDESQRLKGRGTKTSRFSARFKRVDRRIILSGTPIEQRPLDLWAQFRFVAPGVFGDSWPKFAKKWCLRTGWMKKKHKLKPWKLDAFLKRIRPYTLRVMKRDVLDLPELTYRRAPVDLLGRQKRLYDELEADMVASFRGRDITTELKITQLVRFQQICGGFVKTDDEGVIDVGRAKMRKLESILRRIDLPAVVFCKYSEERERIVEAINGTYRVAQIHGRNRKTRSKTIRQFQRGKYDVLVCQVRAGGVGIDLFRASHVIFYSTTFSFIDFDQALSRVHRHGQKKRVVVWLIFARNTVDEDILSAIMKKHSVSELVFARLKRRTTMAKKKTKSEKTQAKASKKSKAKNDDKDDEKPEFKYGVNDLAEALEIKPASVRVRLRNAEIEKAGKQYGWNSKKEFMKVLEEIKPAPRASKDDDDDE